MKRWIQYLTFLCIGVLSTPLYALTITAAIGDYPPYTSESDINARLAEEIVVAAFEASGYQLKVHRTPWKRALEKARSGVVDITFPWLKTPSKSADFWYSDAFIDVQEALIHRKDNPFSWTTAQDLKKYRLGGTLGYSHLKRLKSHGVTVEMAPSDILNLHKVFYRRVDAFPIDKKVGHYLLVGLPKAYEEQLTYSTHLFFDGSFHVVSGKIGEERSKMLIMHFNQGLKVIRSDGSLERILKKYSHKGYSFSSD